MTMKHVKSTRTTKVISISLSPKEDRVLTQLARQASQTKSQFVRESIQREEWQRIMAAGHAVGRRMGLYTDEDVVAWLEQQPPRRL